MSVAFTSPVGPDGDEAPVTRTTDPSLSAVGRVATSALAVVAHPDDESFGLGGVLSALAAGGIPVRVLCLTHGEASTLGAAEDLGIIRARELMAAAAELGIREVTLLDHPGGRLDETPAEVIEAAVEDRLAGADLLVVFEPRGVTGHPDHRAATAAAERVATRHRIAVLEWGVPGAAAAELNREFGTRFVAAVGQRVRVDRAAQWRAIACHRTQARGDAVLQRRLALLGDFECVRLLPAPTARALAYGRRSERRLCPRRFPRGSPRR